MSSGETDAALASAKALSRSVSLDAFVRCDTPGCEWQVHLSGGLPAHCYTHGGPRAPQYFSAADGGIADQRFVEARDCE